MKDIYKAQSSERGLSVKMVADSLSPLGKRICTFELEYHRYFHSELMTHRLFSRNAMSSRAVPIKSMVENCNATPIHWGKNQRGMQAGYELTGKDLEDAQELWEDARESACFMANEMDVVGLHKQVANRILEPFQKMKVVLTATEWDNFFTLRLDKDAQPEIKLLAELMKDVMEISEPQKLIQGQWHTPYVLSEVVDKEVKYFIPCSDDNKEVTKEQALAISSSCCAQVSYRNIDNTFKKAMDIYSRLGVGQAKFHASPFEHVALPMEFDNIFDDPDSELNFKDAFKFTLDGKNGVTHVDGKGDLWSGNFKGFIQQRQVL